LEGGSYKARGTVDYYVTYPVNTGVIASSFNVTLYVDTVDSVIAFITDGFAGGAQWVTPSGYYFVDTTVAPGVCWFNPIGTYSYWLQAYQQALFTQQTFRSSSNDDDDDGLVLQNTYAGLVADPSTCNVSLSFTGSQNAQGKVTNYNVHSFLWEGPCNGGFEAKVFQNVKFNSFGPAPTPAQVALPSYCSTPALLYCDTFYPYCQPTSVPFPIYN